MNKYRKLAIHYFLVAIGYAGLGIGAAFASNFFWSLQNDPSEKDTEIAGLWLMLSGISLLICLVAICWTVLMFVESSWNSEYNRLDMNPGESK